MKILGAIAKHLFFGEFLDVDDSRGNGNVGGTGSVGSGDLDGCRFVVAPATLEKKPATRDIFTNAHILLRAMLIADTPGEVHLDPHVLTPVLGGLGQGSVLERRSRLGRNCHGFWRANIVGSVRRSSLPESRSMTVFAIAK